MAISKPKSKSEHPFEEGMEEKIISLDEKKEETSTIKVSFQDEDLANEFASSPSKFSRDDDSINPNTSADDVKKQVLDYEQQKSSKMEYKDLLRTAEFLVNLIDTAISTGLNFLAKDSAVSAYAMPVPNKKLLTEQLALILSKYQSKFSVEFLFFSGLIVLYAPMAVGAVKNRKKINKFEKKENRTEKEEKKPGEAYYRNDSAVSSPAVEIEKTPDVPTIHEKEVILPPRRGRGKQKKAS